jgi:hypothetical protein
MSSEPLSTDSLIDRLRAAAASPEPPMPALLLEAADELEFNEQSFDLRWDADMRAIRRWQAATGRQLTWPDHADLVVWLLEQLEAR